VRAVVTAGTAMGADVSDEHDNLKRRMRDAVQEVLAGSEYGPPDGGIVAECVVIAGWVDIDGDSGKSHLRCGTAWGTEGLVASTLREIRYSDDLIFTEPDE